MMPTNRATGDAGAAADAASEQLLARSRSAVTRPAQRAQQRTSTSLTPAIKPSNITGIIRSTGAELGTAQPQNVQAGPVRTQRSVRHAVDADPAEQGIDSTAMSGGGPDIKADFKADFKADGKAVDEVTTGAVARSVSRPASRTRVLDGAESQATRVGVREATAAKSVAAKSGPGEGEIQSVRESVRQRLDSDTGLLAAVRSAACFCSCLVFAHGPCYGCFAFICRRSVG